MGFTTIIKHASINIGLYRLARRTARFLRPHQQRDFMSDIEFYRLLLPPKAFVFDVGANVGEKSEALLHAGSSVVAFEPNPLVISELCARCDHIGNWNIVQAAVGSKNTIATLYAREAHGQSSFKKEWGSKIIAKYNVPVITLDEAIECFGTPYYCKIDVEGWELEVLKGLTKIIPLISFEFHLNESGIQNTLSCLELLDNFGESHINITPAETSKFHFKSWMPTKKFIKWFPGDLEHTLPGYLYGDIFVKNFV
jgi:FkbM family methyltransferase